MGLSSGAEAAAWAGAGAKNETETRLVEELKVAALFMWLHLGVCMTHSATRGTHPAGHQPHQSPPEFTLPVVAVIVGRGPQAVRVSGFSVVLDF